MKTIIVTGQAIVNFKQILRLPDDEVDDLLCSHEDLCCNIDIDKAEWTSVDEYRDIETTVS